MEKHKYSGKSKEEAIKKAQEELQELESNLFIREISETKAGLFKSKKVEIEVIEKRDVVQHIKEYLIKILKSMGITANIEIKNKDDVPKYIIYSDNDGILIGKNGKNLKALSIRGCWTLLRIKSTRVSHLLLELLCSISVVGVIIIVKVLITGLKLSRTSLK